MDELTPSQRTALRARITANRDRAAERAVVLARDLDEIITASADAVRDDEHDPEGSTIAFERAQVTALLADARAQQAALEDAARRVDEPGLGRCDRCGERIGFERLLARPASTRCVRCATPSRHARRPAPPAA